MNSESSASNKPKKKKKKRTFNLNRFLKSIIIILLFVVFIGSGLLLGTAYAWVKNAKPLNYDEVFNLNQTTYIVDENDKVIDKLHANQNRTMVTLDQIPVNLQNAVISIEDKRFYKHNGFDIYRMLGALKEDIKTGTASQGGSTITQQLIKNVYLTPDKHLKRKVVEIYYAIQLERRFSKEQILEAYLNTIGFSSNVAGVKEAALYYFGKDLDQLTLAECAMLAGITNNPSVYSPYASLENATKRQKLILTEMLNQGYISQAQYDEANNQEIKLTKVKNEIETTYFSDMIISDVTDALTEKLGYSEDEAKRKLYNGGLKIVATIDTDMQDAVEETFKDTKLFPPSKEDSNGTLQPEAAAVIIDNNTGEIKAIMGGRSSKVKRGLNRATQSLRQPGSSIKPLAVYTPALDNGYTVATVVDDVPTSFGNYSPNNYDRTFRGLLTVRKAIQNSINTVAVKIVNDIGVERSADYLKKFHLTTIETDRSKPKNDLSLASLALGGLTYGVRPIEMAAAYSVFPNKGVYTKPISFTKILDSDGNVIYENKPEKDRVISSQVAYLMVDIMKGVINGGTGGRAALKNMPVAGKTGTTSDNRDAWFVGYTPYYTAAVWMGHDDPKPMNFTGGGYPAGLWKAIMDKVHKNLAYKDFERPDGLVSVDICTASGKRPSQLCALDPRGSTIKSELFIKGTEPSAESICDVHVIKDIDTSTGLLATPYCPTALIQSKVFIQRPVPFVPVPGGKVPDDYKYEAPTKECDVHGPGSVTLPPESDGTIPPGGSDGTVPPTDITPTPTEVPTPSVPQNNTTGH